MIKYVGIVLEKVCNPMSDMNELMERLGYCFQDQAFLVQALRHRSVGPDNNERLEFLGDSVLGVIITTELYRRYPNTREGDLSRLRASLVNGETLASISMDLGVADYLNLGPGEQKSGGQHRHSILADALEAIVGAIFMDAGIEGCQRCVLSWYGERVDDLSKLTPTKDAKSTLQEWLQGQQLPLPEYHVKMTGRAHAQTFIVTCRVKGLAHVTEGKSTTRRKAEQIAAEKFLELING